MIRLNSLFTEREVEADFWMRLDSLAGRKTMFRDIGLWHCGFQSDLDVLGMGLFYGIYFSLSYQYHQGVRICGL